MVKNHSKAAFLMLIMLISLVLLGSCSQPSATSVKSATSPPPTATALPTVTPTTVVSPSPQPSPTASLTPVKSASLTLKYATPTPPGHTTTITTLSFSPDSRLLASSGGDTIKLWQMPDGKLLNTIKVNAEWVVALAFSPDNKTLYSASDYLRDNTQKVLIEAWEVATGKLLNSYELPHSYGWVAFSPDAKSVAITTGGSFEVWELASRKLRWRQELEVDVTSYKYATHSLAFSPDSKLLAGVSYNSNIRLWQVADGTEKLVIPNSAAYELNFSADGQRFTNGQTIWEVATGKELQSFNNKPPQGQLATWLAQAQTVAFSADGTTIVTGGGDIKCIGCPAFNTALLQFWDVANNRLVASPTGHGDRVSRVAISPDGKLVASGSDDKSIKLWELATARLITTLESAGLQTTALAFSTDGQFITANWQDASTRIWEAVSGKAVTTFSANYFQEFSKPTRLSFSQDNKQVISTIYHNFAKIWDVASGQELKQARTRDSGYEYLPAPDGRILAVSATAKENALIIEDALTNQPVTKLTGLADHYKLVVDPAGRIILAGTALNLGKGTDSFRAWELASGRVLASYGLNGHAEVVADVDPNLKYLVTNSIEAVTVYEFTTGRQISTIKGTFLQVALSPDARLLATVAHSQPLQRDQNFVKDDEKLQLWDTATGQLLFTAPQADSAGIGVLSFSPDGKFLASGYNNSTIKLWEVKL